MRSECVYCGTATVPDPQNRQWRHCPKCAPNWTDHILHQQAFQRFLAMRKEVATDNRGLPTRRPI